MISSDYKYVLVNYTNPFEILSKYEGKRLLQVQTTSLDYSSTMLKVDVQTLARLQQVSPCALICKDTSFKNDSGQHGCQEKQ